MSGRSCAKVRAPALPIGLMAGAVTEPHEIGAALSELGIARSRDIHRSARPAHAGESTIRVSLEIDAGSFGVDAPKKVPHACHGSLAPGRVLFAARGDKGEGKALHVPLARLRQWNGRGSNRRRGGDCEAKKSQDHPIAHIRPLF